MDDHDKRVTMIANLHYIQYKRWPSDIASHICENDSAFKVYIVALPRYNYVKRLMAFLNSNLIR